MLGEKPLLGWAAIGFFGLGVLLGALLLARPGLMRLVLDDDGFEMISPVRTSVTRPEAAIARNFSFAATSSERSD